MKNNVLAIFLIATVISTSSSGYAASRQGQDVNTRVDEANQEAPVNNPANRDLATAGHVNYSDTKLSNYQDPYLTNPRAYQSNQYGAAAAPPRPNSFNAVTPAPMRRVDNYNYDANTGSYTGY